MIEAEESPDGTLLTRRRRCASFNKAEVKVLIKLVEKYKSIIQNRSVTSTVNRLKENTWEKITKAFNKQAFENVRSADCLKTKWENLKKIAKKSSNKSLEEQDIENNDDYIRSVKTIIAHTEDNPNITKTLSESDEEKNSVDNLESWEQCINKDGNSDGEIEHKRRMRARTFKLEEVKSLLNLIEKYKSIILNKSNNTVVNQAKEDAWNKICKEYNKQGFVNFRSSECLKMKWENLKKESKKLTKNESYSGMDDVMSHTVALITQMTDDPYSKGTIIVSTLDMNGKDGESNEDNVTEKWEEKMFDNSDDETVNNESPKFSPRECAILLDCVKREKSSLFINRNTTAAHRIKNRVWDRITKSYNRLSPQKRTKKDLRDKFINIKKLSNGIVNFKKCLPEKPVINDIEDTAQLIKSEQEFEYDAGSDTVNNKTDDEETFLDNKEDDKQMAFTDDPLNVVLNSDSGIGWPNSCEDKQINKMKQELLNYEMETAKLKRKRIEDLIVADNAHREAIQVETALKMRAARLEAIAAELKLPALHPALQFTAEEAPAQEYMNRYHMT